MDNIIELTTFKQWIEAYPIIHQLRTNLTEESYIDLLMKMREQGYQLFALYVEGSIVSVAGVALRVSFYNERHLFVYDLVTDSACLSHGYGKKLLNFIHQWAKEIEAEYVALESGIQRIDAHRFYEEKMDYDKWCYSFRKKI